MRRTALTRKTPLKAGTWPRIDSKEADAVAKERRPRKCHNKGCGSLFVPFNSMQVWCSPECGAAIALERLETKKAVEQKADRAETRAKLNTIKPLGKLLAEAQVAFNAFIRARDANQTCICCGKPFELQKPGGSMDAGHYLSRGSAPHLRFDERNCFGQRKNCNRPGGTTREKFRAGVEARIGREALESLESEQTITKWTRERAMEIKETYRAKLRELKRKA